jgi:hypothetical protein
MRSANDLGEVGSQTSADEVPAEGASNVKPGVHHVYISSIRDHPDIRIVSHHLALQRKAIVDAVLHNFLWVIVGCFLTLFAVAVNPKSAQPVLSVLEKLLPVIEPHQLVCTLLLCVALGWYFGRRGNR